MVDELLPVLGVVREVGVGARERVAHGVEPGDEEQEQRVEDVVAGEAFAVDLRLQEVGEDVVGRVLLSLVELLA